MSARDVGPPGHDLATGFGVLDIPAALAFPAPPPDPSEPNDDVRPLRRAIRPSNQSVDIATQKTPVAQ